MLYDLYTVDRTEIHRRDWIWERGYYLDEVELPEKAGLEEIRRLLHPYDIVARYIDVTEHGQTMLVFNRITHEPLAFLSPTDKS